MNWEIGNTEVKVWGTTPDEENWLGDYLSYVDRQYGVRKGRPSSTTVRLYTPLLGTFPGGFARATYAAARKAGHHISYIDARVPPCTPDPAADLGWLREYQRDAITAVIQRHRGLVRCPTGSGKTEVAVGLTRALPCRWLFLVHRSSLLSSTAKRYEDRTGLKAGVIGDGRFEVSDDTNLIICSFQTAHAAYKRGNRQVLDVIESCGGVIVDECHAVGAETFAATVMRTHKAYYRVGLSATPLSRDDNRNQQVIGGLGHIIYQIDPKTLQDAGMLAIPTIRMVEHPHQASDKVTYGGVYNDCVVRDVSRSKHIVEVVKRAPKPCMVFVQLIEHGEDITARLVKAGVSAEFVSGKDSTALRDAAVQRLVRTDIDCIVVNVVFQEGVDVPSLRSVVIASGGASTIAAVQRVGRGMRIDKASGKTTFDVYDIADKGCGCTASDNEYKPHLSCKWLEKHTAARRRAYKTEGYEVVTESDQRDLLTALAPS